MPEITEIKQTKKGRWALFSSEGFLFSVDERTLADSDVHRGDVLDGPALEQLRAASDTRAAMQAAGRLLGRRAHSAHELRHKLLRRYDEDTADEVLAELDELELIDDVAYAEERVRTMALRGKSRLEITAKLYEARVSRDIAQQAVDALGQTDAERALLVLNRNYRQALEDGEDEKVLAALGRRGFSRQDCLAALNAAREDDVE